MSMLPDRPIPVATTRRGGFSLVLSLTVMSMLLLLCIGAAALLAIELRAARASSSQARARLNAVAGARVALGEIQRLLGPDQRVSATATILPLQSTLGTMQQPRWTGVWNAGPDKDGNKWLTRNTNDTLEDTRNTAANGATGNWAVDRVEGPRQLGWIVSGNEALPRSEQKNPYTALINTETCEVVGPRSLNLANRNIGTSKYLQTPFVSVPRVSFPDGKNSYAYWVSDEGVKAKFNMGTLRATAAPNAGSPQNGGYARLTAPNRLNFDYAVSEKGEQVLGDDFSKLPIEQIRKTDSFSGLSSTGLTEAAALAMQNLLWHDITFTSGGVLSDTFNGGLKRDLTAYTEANTQPAGGSLPAVNGFPALADTDPILNAARLAPISPKYSVLRSWAGIDAASRPALAANSVSIIPPANFANSTRYSIPDYSQNINSTRAPILSHAAVHFQPYYDAALIKSRKLGVVIMPKVVLWNPYSTPLDVSNLKVRFCTLIDLRIRIQPSSTQRDGYGFFWNTSTNFGNPDRNTAETRLKFQIPAGTILAPGESAVFQAPGGLPQMAPYNGASTNYNTLAKTNAKANTGFKDETRDRNTSSVFGPLPQAYFDDIEKDPANALISRIWVSSSTVNASGYSPLAASREAVSQVHLFAADGKTMLQQIDNDAYATSVLGYGNSAFTSGIIPAMFPAPPTPIINGLAEAVNRPAHVSVITRLTYFDDPTSASSGSLARNKEYNGLVSYNFRATRFTRFPNDGVNLQRVSKDFGSSLFTTEMEAKGVDDDSYAHQNGTQAPLFSNYAPRPSAWTSYKFSIFDVPRKETGVTSLGALQSANLIKFPWAPALAFGNAYPHPGLPLDQSGWGAANEPGLWKDTFAAAGLSGAPAILTAPVVGSSVNLLMDWSFELNHALWDSWFASGIPAENSGWASAGTNGRWDIAPALTAGTDNTRFRNERLTPIAPIETTALLYKPAQSLLLEGAFNINSTSLTAWKALLSANRNIEIPTRTAGSDTAQGTPVLRNLYPELDSRDATAGTFSARSWAGFRRLSDDEIQKLAEKIVAEVKRRGPFLSLSDFVNRRLRPGNMDGLGRPDNAADGTVDAYDYLGALQAAIERAKLNQRFGNGSTDTQTNLTDAGPMLNGTYSTTNPVKPAQRVEHRAAGAPGYVLQGDILQSIGGVISARSDTFTIRVVGESEGATAVYEVTVQRTTEAVQPDTNNGSNRYIPLNPMFLGRRFKVVSQRWLSPDTI